MGAKRELLDALAGLFRYPQGDFAQRLETVSNLADARSEDRSQAVRDLLEKTRSLDRGGVEEMFTRTFEINPVCALEIGWHIYGEDYARGALLVRLRSELRSRGIKEITELPDHLTHVLQLLGRLETELADDLAGRYILPALRKMIEAVEDTDCPYTGMLRMTRDIVADEHDAVEIEPPERRKEPPGMKSRKSLLMPVLGQVEQGGCGSGGCGGSIPGSDEERGGSWV